ncbi:MAG: beta-glucuronidase [Bacteroidales bacterium]|nr:beta-glucuronidase [Bacteroidales bacterium]
MKLQLTMAAIMAASFVASGQNIVQNIDGRNPMSLEGEWNYIPDLYRSGYFDYRLNPYDNGGWYEGGWYMDRNSRANKQALVEYDFDLAPTIHVPGDWNSQDDRMYYYEGTVWLRKKFDFKRKPGCRAFLRIEAANYESDTYLNGKKLGKHIGGFTPFDYEITDVVKDGQNSLVVRVDNTRIPEGVPTVNTDWWNYGGITRDVFVVQTPETFIADYMVQLKKGSMDEIEVSVTLDGPQKSQPVTVAIPELKIKKELPADGTGKYTATFKAKKLSLWEPGNAKLYEVNISTASDAISEKIGFRSIEAVGTDIMLNGRSVFLCGISIHEENPLRGGRAYSMEDAKYMLGKAVELGCNYVRLAHYPHNRNILKLADSLGIMVWEENPVYWTIHWDNQNTYNLAKQQLGEMIWRDKNRACVVIRSMANETPVSEVRTQFLAKLAKYARECDDTRLISAASELHGDKENKRLKIVDDPFSEYVDILSFNEYIGWYEGLPDKCDTTMWLVKYNKPVTISEFGGGAVQGRHGGKNERWTEEFQADLYERSVKMLDQIPQLRGMTPWILFDFRSPKRMLTGTQDGWNKKGIVGNNGKNKMAFDVLKNYYAKKSAEYATPQKKK